MVFAEIDRKYNFEEGTAQHTYHRLMDEKAISRVTITMTRPQTRYNAIILMRIINGGEFEGTRTELLNEIMKETDAPTNHFVLVSDILSPFSIMFVLPVFEENELLETEKSLRTKMRGVDIQTLIVSNTLIGNLCYRRFDNTQTSEMVMLTEDIIVQKGKASKD